MEKAIQFRITKNYTFNIYSFTIKNEFEYTLADSKFFESS